MEEVDRFMHFYCTFFTKIGMDPHSGHQTHAGFNIQKIHIPLENPNPDNYYGWQSEFSPKLQPLSLSFLGKNQIFHQSTLLQNFQELLHQQNEGVD